MIEGTINRDDIIQVIIGAAALTIPVAFSEEAWKLSRTLPTVNVIILLLLSLLLISLYSIQGIFSGNINHRIIQFISRTFIVYGVTMIVVFLVLFAINRMPILDEPIIALKRIVLISFPASLGGVIVDGFDKE
ncbi:MAG: putative membrane protein [Saprospiraceae bacterium]|jgi:uncharacterized membrane protein